MELFVLEHTLVHDGPSFILYIKESFMTRDHSFRDLLRTEFIRGLKEPGLLRTIATVCAGGTVISFVGGIYYTAPVQHFAYGQYGHPNEWRFVAGVTFALILAYLALAIVKETKSTPAGEPPFQHVFSCTAFIPTPPQYLSLKISLEIPKAEKDLTKLAQVENAATAAITKAASTLPPNTEQHAIHPKIESEIRQALRRTSHFSYVNPHILSLEFSSKSPTTQAAAVPSDDIDVGYHL